MNLDELRSSLHDKVAESGANPEAVERMALHLALAMPAVIRKELSEIALDLDDGGWTFVAERAGRSALVASDQAQGIERRQPPRIRPRLLSAPKIREFFWCDYPDDAQLPEFWKTRPVLVVSYRNRLPDTVTVVPCTSQSQAGNKWACKLSMSIDGQQESWAICDKPMSLAVSRLSSARMIKRLPEDEFNGGVLKLVLDWLPRLPNATGNGNVSGPQA